MAKHTPGPWQSEQSEMGSGLTFVITQVRPIGDESPEFNTDFIARLTKGFFFNRTASEVEANARLIAAAPDLLAACLECMKFVDEAYEATATGFFKVAKTSEQRLKIEAAIAKAKGGTD